MNTTSWNGHWKLCHHNLCASKICIGSLGIHANSGSKKSSLLWFNFLVAARAVHVFSFGSDPAATNAKPDCSSKTGTHFADCSAPCLAHDSTTVQVHFLRPIVTDENHVQAVRRHRLPSNSSFWQPVLWTTGLSNVEKRECRKLRPQFLEPAHAQTYNLHTSHDDAGALQYLRAGIRNLAAKRWLQNNDTNSKINSNSNRNNLMKHSSNENSNKI